MQKEQIKKLIDECEVSLADRFKTLDEISYFNQVKVLNAFKANKIALRHFSSTTGYGYGDEGREALGRVYAQIFGTEEGIVSPNLLSGTHALMVGLFGILRPNDLMLSVTGEVYDTLRGVIGGENVGSLKDFGVKYDKIALTNGDFDYEAIKNRLSDAHLKMIYIQRSRGYELRDALNCAQIGKLCSFLRENGFNGCIFVDNCYGEFVEKQEPTDVGADVAVGSLIKNAGGGFACTGGYVVGKSRYIDLISRRLTTPSTGGEIGSYAFGYQYYYQGVFIAPHTVNQALKGSLLMCAALNKLGYASYPALDVIPADITRAIRFDTEKQLTDFIQSVQDCSPIDSFVKLEAWDMPGYDCKVIMAAGCFVQGSSIELSADAPIREPYVAYFQGGLTYEHCKYALSNVLTKL